MIAFDVAPLFENITGSNCNLIRAKTDDSAIGVFYGKTVMAIIALRFYLNRSRR